MGRYELDPLLSGLGMVCHCVSCNTRYRAYGKISLKVLYWSNLLLLGALSIVGVALMFFFVSSWIVRFITLAAFVFHLALVVPRLSFKAASQVWWNHADLERTIQYDADI